MPPAGIFPALCIKRTNIIAALNPHVNHYVGMQDKTITNALLALYKRGGEQADLASELLALRGVPLPRFQNNPLRRGETQRLVLGALRDGPKTNTQLGAVIQRERPEISHRAAANRSYQALLRLEAKGLVKRDGRVWRPLRD